MTPQPCRLSTSDRLTAPVAARTLGVPLERILDLVRAGRLRGDASQGRMLVSAADVHRLQAEDAPAGFSSSTS